MLNPALIAALTANSAIQYERIRAERMPWTLSFLVAPLVLHRATRESLPRDIRTHLGTWVANNPTLHAGFGMRAVELRDCVREGVRFGLRYGGLEIDDDGTISGNLRGGVVDAAGKMKKVAEARAAGDDRVVAVLAEDSDLGQVIQKAGLVGRWFTKLETPATAFVILGVSP